MFDGQLRDVLNLDIFPFPSRRRIVLDNREQRLVQFGRRNAAVTVCVHLLGGFQHFEDSLLRQGRDKQNREVGEWSQTRTDGIRKGINHLLVLFLHQIPLVYTNDHSFFVFLHQREDVQILAFNAARRI